MRLLHYSPKPLTKTTSHEQFGEGHSKCGYQMKPRGLWVSVEGEHDWKSWCESEKFRLDWLRYETEVVLKEDANILVLSTAEEIEAFTDKYLNKNSSLKIAREVCGDVYNQKRHDCYAIDWPLVARDYQGIIIAPYNWEIRWECMWYYTWDCASGCIWDASAIKELIQPKNESFCRWWKYLNLGLLGWIDRLPITRKIWHWKMKAMLTKCWAYSRKDGVKNAKR